MVIKVTSRLSHVVNLLFSGDWAGGVWAGSGIPGQEQSCAQRTGQSSCQTYVLDNGAAFSEACEFTPERTHAQLTQISDWEVSYVKLYQ